MGRRTHPGLTPPRLRHRSAESSPMLTHPGAGVMATSDPAGRNTAHAPICDARGPSQTRAVWVPQAQLLLTKAGRVKGACGFQPLRWRTMVGMALRPAGDRNPGGTGPSACSPPHGSITRSPMTCPTPSGASWCLGHTGGCGLCSGLPTDIAG